MQKIAHINLAKGFRGGERQTLVLVEELSKLGFMQVVVTRLKSQLAERLVHIQNIEIIQIAKPYMFNLSKIKDVSLLHAHETKGAHFCYFANKIYDIPYMITRRVDKPVKNNLFNIKLYEDAFCTIAISKVIKDKLLQISSTINIKIIPDSLNALVINDTKMMEIKSKFHDKFLLGHVGELDNEDKGQQYLIEAMQSLEKGHPNIHLLLLGKGKDEHTFKNQAKNLNNITFVGFVNNVGDYISCFDLFVFPSLHEGFGSTLLDVMKLEVPIIASNVGGIPDIIKDGQNGILMSPKSATEIEENILRLYHDSVLAKRLSTRAKSDVVEYTPVKITKEYMTLYREMI